MEFYNNDPNFRIAIYIGGNIERRNGFGQIVSIGALAGDEYTKLDAPPISRGSTSENPVFTIKNAESYVLYKIWDDSVLISDDMNKGRLVIGMTIPSNARLKDGKSPYTLLMEIYGKFLELGTELTEDGRRRFKRVELEKEVFQTIIDQYPIEYAQNRVEPMKGNRRGQLQITSTKEMEDFFRDTQYEEFTEYEAIEVTTQGLNMFPNLRIPKPKGYQIVVNGQLAKELTNKEKVKILWEGGNEEFIARCDSTLDYRYEPLHISIDKLRKASNTTLMSQDGNSKAVLDETTQTITCTLNPIPKWYKKDIKYDLNSDDGAERYCRENMGKRIKILVNGLEWNEDKIQPSRVAHQHSDGNIETKKDIFSISPDETEDYKYSVSDVKLNGDNLQVFIKAKKNKIGDRHSSDGKPTGSGLDLKSLLIGTIIGIALGVAGFWVMQTVLSNSQEKKAQKKAQDEENVAWNSLKDLTPGNPEQAMQFRNYLRKFSKEDISISKGDSVPEKIYGSFDYPNATNIGNAKKKLQTYVNDSIQAERDEQEAFESCTDITACNNYLDTYNPVQDHKYFEKGKHVDAVWKKKEELEAAKKEADAQAAAEQKRTKESTIKSEVEKKSLEFLNASTRNSDNRNAYTKWLDSNNESWRLEFKEKKTNRKILANKANWIDLILSIPGGPTGKPYVDYLKGCDKYQNNSFSNSNSDWNIIKKLATDIDNYKNGKIKTFPE